MKRNWKAGVCAALCSAMVFTGIGPVLTPYLENAVVYADENENSGVKKVFTADQLKVAWGDADYELADGQWKLSFAKQYNQVKWTLPESIEMSQVNAVTFQVADQKVPISLKVYNGGDDATAANTQYGLSGQTEYTINPSGDGTIDAVGIMITEDKPENATVSLVSVTFELKAGAGDAKLGDNIIKNGDFATSEAAESWNSAAGESVVSVAAEEEEIADSGLKTYGVLTRNQETATPGDCFSQDITDAVEKGETYKFSFWAKLSDDYKDAPEEQRNVEFAPFYVSGGEATYLGSYSAGILSGDCTKTLKAGEWTKYEGTFKIPKAADQVVIRIIEQGTNYGQGDCVKGTYYVTGVSMNKIEREKPSIEKDIPDWKESVKAALGNDVVAGTAVTGDEINDDTLMELVEKHFNAVTFGNELKPDALFNYQLEDKVNTKTIQFKGQDLEVPVVNEAGDSLDFSRADKLINKICEWNNENPDNKIRIRGHVLVWHSQTQEWFFHENYDKTKPYVDKETMNRRLEWFISSVFDHYFGEAANGKYDGLFYGWDVVNEAVIGNSYRTDTVSAAESLDEIRHGNNSSWWHVYKSNEFIINAFRYANQYAPKNVELYYNDFGETDNTKCEGIVKLINDVKAADGTRLDAFGMQAHYSVDSFSATQFKTVAEKYAKAAGKVQLTELDFKSSASYTSGMATKESEYTKIAYCHKQLFDAIKGLKADGSNVSGLTVWGVIEPNSWLHEQSGVGGGADGSAQCPLLFDGNYKAKPAYWAYVDASRLQPSIQDVVAAEKKGDAVTGKTYSIMQNDITASFISMWDKDGLTVQVTVEDAVKDDNDAVAVYVDSANSGKDDITPVTVTVKRSEAAEVENGYQATIKVPLSGLSVAKVIGMDVVVTNGDKTAAFNDLTGKQGTSSKYYAKVTMKPGVEKAAYGTVTVDGDKDAVWDNAGTIPITINLGSNVSANAKLLWDKDNFYVYAEIKDPVLNNTNGDAWEQDSLEVFIDENNGKSNSYEDDDKQYRISYVNDHSFNGKKCLEENMKSVAKITSDGYVVEASFKWTDITPKAGDEIGLEFQINDADASGKRIGTLSWNDETGMGWSKPEVFGTVKLGEIKNAPEKDTEKKPETEKKEVKVKKITLNKTKAGMKKGATLTLKAVVSPSDADIKDVKWTSSNKKVATVDKHGKVKALKNGVTTITAMAKDGSRVSASCKITVGYKITYKLGKGKNSSKNPEYYYNEKVNLKSASKKGYVFKGWYTDSKYTKRIKTISKSSKKNLTLYAKWQKVTVKKSAIKKMKAVSGRKAKVTVQKVDGAAGYQIVYSTDKQFKKNVKKVTISGTSKTLGKLAKGKTYYVKVRAYKKDSTGAKVYGSFSSAKKIKISK